MFYPQHYLFFDDVQIGQEWRSLSRTVTEADIVNFAGISGDFNLIHVDHEFAKTTMFRQPIAHGLLVWAIASGLSSTAPPMRTIAFMSIRDWHFREPVFIGDTVHVFSKVLEKEERSRGKRGVIAWGRRILNQSGKVVQEGTTLTMVEGRANITKSPRMNAKNPGGNDYLKPN